MTTMVVGANGFVGRHLVAHLREWPHEVVAVTRDGPGWPDLDPTVPTMRVDVRDQRAVDALLRAGRPSCVVNLTTSRGSPAQMDAVNRVGAARLARACARHGVQRLVHLTSSTQYGPVPAPKREDGPWRPATGYGRTKLAGSTAALTMGQRTDLEVVVLVAFQVYGTGQRGATLLEEALTRVRTKAELPLTPPGCTRDYVEVSDIVRAVRAAVDRPGIAGHVLNVCSGVATDNHEVVDIVERVVGRPVPRRIGAVEPRPWDHDDWRGDPGRAAELLRWRASLSLEEGIARLAQRVVTR